MYLHAFSVWFFQANVRYTQSPGTCRLVHEWYWRLWVSWGIRSKLLQYISGGKKACESMWSINILSVSTNISMFASNRVSACCHVQYKCCPRAGVKFDVSASYSTQLDQYRSISRLVSMVTRWIYICVCFSGSDHGKSEGYGLGLVCPDVHGQEIEGKDGCWSSVCFFSKTRSMQLTLMLAAYYKTWTATKNSICLDNNYFYTIASSIVIPFSL